MTARTMTKNTGKYRKCAKVIGALRKYRKYTNGRQTAHPCTPTGMLSTALAATRRVAECRHNHCWTPQDRTTVMLWQCTISMRVDSPECTTAATTPKAQLNREQCTYMYVQGYVWAVCPAVFWQSSRPFTGPLHSIVYDRAQSIVTCQRLSLLLYPGLGLAQHNALCHTTDILGLCGIVACCGGVKSLLFSSSELYNIITLLFHVSDNLLFMPNDIVTNPFRCFCHLTWYGCTPVESVHVTTLLVPIFHPAADGFSELVVHEKSIWYILMFLRSFLKHLRGFTWTDDCNRVVQWLKTVTEKSTFASHLLWSFTSFHLWPGVQLPSATLENDCRGTVEMPQSMFNSSMKLAWFLVSSSDHSLSFVSFSLYCMDFNYQEVNYIDVGLFLTEASLLCSGDFRPM